MKVARLYGRGDVRVTDEPEPKVEPGFSLIRVTAVGLCGSDLHWYAEGGIGDAMLDEPLVVGHEFAGVVESGPLAGQRVAVDPAIPCEHCDMCRRGWQNLCRNIQFAGHGHLDGALQEYLAWPTGLLHPLPAGLTDVDGAMLEPLGVALHALDLGHVRLGDRVGVFGCGPIGLLLLQAAQGAGATVVATDPLAHRQEAARRLGAVVVADADLPEVDVAFEVAGTDAAVESAMRAARPGARVVLVGIPDDDTTRFPAAVARRKGLTILLSRRMNEIYPRAIDLAERGLIDLASLVTHRFPLTEAPEAFAVAQARTGLKVTIEM